MKSYLMMGAIFLSLVSSAEAKDFFKVSKSGILKPLHRYYSFARDCSAREGIVRLVTKPSRGKLTTREVNWKIGVARTGYAGCVGKPVKAFEVAYQSEPGFVGTDKFIVDVFFGASKKRYLDTFTVTVQP